MPSCGDVALGAIRRKVDRLDSFPLGASILKVNTEAYVKIMTQYTMYNVEQIVINFDLQRVVQTLIYSILWAIRSSFSLRPLFNILSVGLGPLFLFRKQSLLTIILSFFEGQELCMSDGCL